MISKLMQAFTGKGESKVFIADKKVDIPQTVAEAVGLWGEDKLVKMACESYVIAVQSDLRKGSSTSAKTQLNDLIAAAHQQKRDGDSALFDRLVSVEIIKE